MPITPEQSLAIALDPASLFELMGYRPDPWQEQLLRSTAQRILLNCCRQAGKSTAVAALALHTALFKPNTLTLLLSRAQRQATELFRKVLDFYNAMGRPLKPLNESVLKIELPNGSRIIALPGKEANIRSYSGVELLIIDEAARVTDDLYKSVRPMLAVSGGRLICLSTPFGRRGFFHDEWTNEDATWLRFEVQADKIQRITHDFLTEELAALGQSWFDQEYRCSFQAMEGLVYPEFRQCLVDIVPLMRGRNVGGIDFGFHNPFAAVWGMLDDQDVLWITNERYERNQPLHRHAERIPKHTRWIADPAGANEIAELRSAGFVVQRADNSLRAGIAAVTARIQTGRLKVLSLGCTNLIEEAGLYRYPSEHERDRGENPVDEYNHALAALRYLVSRLDQKFMIKFRRGQGSGSHQTEKETQLEADSNLPIDPRTRKQIDWMDLRNESLWTPIN